MASLLSSIGTMASTFINSISIIADSCSLVFTIFPIEIKATIGRYIQTLKISLLVNVVIIVLIQLVIDVNTLVILFKAVDIKTPPFYFNILKIEHKKTVKNMNKPRNIIKNNIPAKTYSIQIQYSGATPKNS